MSARLFDGRPIDGVLFDLDGTLVDTETLYRRFWVEAAQALGYPMQPHHALMIRSMAPAYAEPLLRREVCPDFDYHAVRELRRTRMEAYVAANGVQPKPGMRELLEALRARGLRIGLATASPEPRARDVLRRVGAEAYFDAVTCGNMVQRGKPAPDLYRMAARRTGLVPSCAIAVEDAPAGVRAAHDAGLAVVMVPDLGEVDAQTRALCVAVVPTLAAVTPLLLRA